MEASGYDEDTFERPRSSYPWGCWFALLGLVGLLFVGYAFQAGYLPVRPFDASLWRQVRTADNHVRLRMVEWLLRSGQLDGLTRPQVIAVLGQPDGGSYFKEWDFVYWLGPERGHFGIDSEWLVIRLGPDGRVADYRVVRD